MSIFDGYDEEYQSITNEITKKLSEVVSYETDPDKNAASLTQVSRLVGQAGQLIDQMNLEVRSLEPATRKQLQKKVRQYKDSLNSLEEDFNRVKEKTDRATLVGGGGGGGGGGGLSAEHRERMEDTTGRLQGTSRTLENALNTVAETEDVAMGITEELGRNREMIIKAHGKVKQTGSITDSARQLIGRMQNRETRQRYITKALVAFMFLAICVALYYMFAGGDDSDSGETPVPAPAAAPTPAP